MTLAGKLLHQKCPLLDVKAKEVPLCEKITMYKVKNSLQSDTDMHPTEI